MDVPVTGRSGASGSLRRNLKAGPRWESIMMLSACGFRCDLCPAFKQNISGPEDQVALSKGWKKYYDIDMLPDQIICDGCRATLAQGRELPARECETRNCVMERGLDSCGQCEDYLCKRRESLMAGVERISEKHRESISEEEYSLFFEPYESRKNLEELRRNK